MRESREERRARKMALRSTAEVWRQRMAEETPEARGIHAIHVARVALAHSPWQRRSEAHIRESLRCVRTLADADATMATEALRYALAHPEP